MNRCIEILEAHQFSVEEEFAAVAQAREELEDLVQAAVAVVSSFALEEQNRFVFS